MRSAHISHVVQLIIFLLISTSHSHGQESAENGIEFGLVDIGASFDSFSDALGINNNGDVVGGYDPGLNSLFAFLYSNGAVTRLRIPNNNVYSISTAINDSGTIVGGYSLHGPDGRVHRGYILRNNIRTDIETLGGPYNHILDINNSGNIVGVSDDVDNIQQAFARINGDIVNLGVLLTNSMRSEAVSINNNDEIVGTYTDNNNQIRSFLYSNGQMQSFDNYKDMDTYATAINDFGVIVGYTRLNTRTQAFMHHNGKASRLNISEDTQSYASDINNNGHIVGSSSAGTNGGAFLYKDGRILFLSDLIDKNLGWHLDSAYAINDKGQIVGHGSGRNENLKAFQLNPLPADWKRQLEVQPSQKLYNNCFQKNEEANSLVLVTHGWTTMLPGLPPKHSIWVDQMTNALINFLEERGKVNWQVHGYRWLTNSWVPSPDKALHNAEQEGFHLGICLAQQNWKHIHMIAHSAGCALIQAACENIKSLSPGTVVHLTFLDAYVGSDYSNSDIYGQSADWADHYIAQDSETGGERWPLTESRLSNAYNIDVTYLDNNKVFVGIYSPPLSSDLFEYCYKTESSHGWPIDYYIQTINGDNVYQRGFFLTAENNKWFEAMTYLKGNTPVETLGVPDNSCVGSLPTIASGYIDALIDFKLHRSIQSTTGIIQMFKNAVSLITGSPVWLAIPISKTNMLSYVIFDAAFLPSIERNGLLSVYWDTNLIGTLEESIVGSGIRRYKLDFPPTSDGLTHVLGFRLDSFSSEQSSIILTNVTVGGKRQIPPFRLALATNTFDGLPVFSVNGSSGVVYAIESSTNLTDWTVVAKIVSSNDVAKFIEPRGITTGQRFYRAIAH